MINKRLSCWLLLALCACHRPAPLEPARTNISPSKPLDRLSEDEVQELCQRLSPDGGSYLPTQLERCRLDALRKATSTFDCEARASLCLFGSSETEVWCKLTPETFIGCDASINAFETCARDRAASDERYYAGLTCDDVGSSDFGRPLPSSCETLGSRCPGLIEGAGQDTDSDPPGGGGNSAGAGSDGVYVDGGRVCDDGRDIDDAWWCDETVDCFEGEDEQACETPQIFRCGDGKRISAALACDRTNDCADRSDELNCDDGYLCLDGQDIWDNRRCDGNRDCTRGEDEESCN